MWRKKIECVQKVIAGKIMSATGVTGQDNGWSSWFEECDLCKDYTDLIEMK